MAITGVLTELGDKGAQDLLFSTAGKLGQDTEIQGWENKIIYIDFAVNGIFETFILVLK